MRHKRENFKKILIIELEDLDEDIQMLIQEANDKAQKGEISNYVFSENIAVLKNELFGVEGYLEDIRKLDIEKYESLDIMIEGCKSILQKRVSERGLARSIIVLVDRKINKVKTYMDQ